MATEMLSPPFGGRDTDLRLLSAGHRPSASSRKVSVVSEEPRKEDDSHIASQPLSIRNLRMMHLLERIAGKFNEAGVPLMALKGAALNLTLYDRPDARPMGDLDLMIRPTDVDRAFALLEGLGGLRGEPHVTEGFFPRFHYETEYRLGTIHPVTIDLHVRPFRPLRYSRLVPPDALWDSAEAVPLGKATVLIPSAEEMLIHLTAHLAIHGSAKPMWLQDIKRWADARRTDINWDRLLAAVKQRRLALPVREAFQAVEREFGPVLPPEVSRRLGEIRVNWRDRLALRQAPRDADHPVAHVAVNVLCTPGLRFALGYLSAVLMPDIGHMGDWYYRRHWGWLPCAHLLRWVRPLVRRIPSLWTWFARIETRKSPMHGIGVFTARAVREKEVIARYQGKPVDYDGLYVVPHERPTGEQQRYEITGKLRFLNHSCRPNAELLGFELIALRPIRAGQEITIDYGEGTCDCCRSRREIEGPPRNSTAADAA